MSNNSYRIGVVGLGYVGTNRHIPSYQTDNRAELAAVYDHKLVKAQRVTDEHGIEHAHDDFSEFLSRDLDLVSICTPPWLHAEQTVQALESGVHVLSEKPMAMTPDAAQRMVDAADENDRYLGLVHNFLFSRSMQKAKRIVESGKLGEVKTAMGFQTSSPRRHLPTWYPDLPGELFYDESPHLLYLLEDVLGDLSVEHVSTATDEDAMQTLQTVNANFRGPSGTLGTLTMVFDAPLSEWHFTIVGTEKVLVADIFRDILLVFDEEEAHNTKDVIGTSLSAMAQETTGMLATGMNMVQGEQLFGMGELVSRYLDGLDNGTGPPVTGKEGKRIVDAMHGVLAEAGVDTESNFK
jgi:predicted dehydrogenase